MLCKDLKLLLVIIVYLFTSSDKTIYRDLELLTSTSYTVGSGFDPQGVRIYNGALDLCIYTYLSWQNYF